MILVTLLLMSTGLMFLVYPRSITDGSSRQIAERVVMSRWVGGSLIIMSCLFLIMGAMQLLDEASHHIGH
ncbi:hypothetical protein [Paenibacillus illinoisensis]|uniref:hypothetical protein n=1 Tax=Paenibacillus illinoisensis TaxID=59845 RepID=UPI000FDCC3B0|nr:hypothetical protein [Paenibacillus illinoisensis]